MSPFFDARSTWCIYLRMGIWSGSKLSERAVIKNPSITWFILPSANSHTIKWSAVSSVDHDHKQPPSVNLPSINSHKIFQLQWLTRHRKVWFSFLLPHVSMNRPLVETDVCCFHCCFCCSFHLLVGELLVVVAVMLSVVLLQLMSVVLCNTLWSWWWLRWWS